MLLAIIAVVGAVLVPGLAERLLDTPFTWADLTCGLQRSGRAAPTPS